MTPAAGGSASGRAGMLAVVSAPSGAGKTSILFEVLKRHPEVSFSVSATTRSPRTGEREGVNYHFVPDAAFDRLIAEGELLEWNRVHDRRYGTLRAPVMSVLAEGGTILLDTDTVGAFNIRANVPDAVLIFIIPPTPAVLRQRLEDRGTESPGRIEARLRAAPHEVARMSEYDYVVINDVLEDAIGRIGEIIEHRPEVEQYRSAVIVPKLTEWRNCINGERSPEEACT